MPVVVEPQTLDEMLSGLDGGAGADTLVGFDGIYNNAAATENDTDGDSDSGDSGRGGAVGLGRRSSPSADVVPRLAPARVSPTSPPQLSRRRPLARDPRRRVPDPRHGLRRRRRQCGRSWPGSDLVLPSTLALLQQKGTKIIHRP